MGYLDVSSDEMSQFAVSSMLPLTLRFPPGLKLKFRRRPVRNPVQLNAKTAQSTPNWPR